MLSEYPTTPANWAEEKKNAEDIGTEKKLQDRIGGKHAEIFF